jgi:hypothetical protein
MATTSKRTIHLLGQPVYNEDGAAAEAIIPGHLLRGVTSLSKNNTTNERCPVIVALEREEMGKSIDDAYAIGDTVKVGHFQQGHHFLGWLASGQNVAAGALLGSNGAGLFTAASVTHATAVVRALEALNATANARIRLEVL